VLHASVTGPLDQPLFAGYAQIADGRIRHLSLPQSIQAINGRVSFGPDGISLDKVTAQVAGGKVTFGGRVEINGFALGALELTASGQRMEFRYPEGFRSTVDADFDLVGTMSAPILRGTVTVRNVLYDKRIDLGSPAMIALARGRVSDLTESSSGRMPPIRLDVHILAPSSLRVENNIAHVVASADLWLRGTYDHPQISGGADVERGEVLVLGRRYLVRRGRIEFPNPAKLEPYFDLSGETLVRVPGQTYVVNVQLTGTTSVFSPVVTSDPPLSQIEIMTLLLGGETNADVRNAEMGTLQKEEAQRTLATTQVQYAAAGFATAPLTKAVETTFGLDTFQLTPNVGYDPYQRLSPTARLTVGKRISNKIYLTYSRSLNTPGGADQVILLEYDQSEKLSWILSRNEDGTYALDVRVRHVF
jgi:autotransporter translocation and assembly factor TamB